MPDKKYEVKQAKVKEVSLVPAGANGEEFAMFKSYEEEEDESEEEKDMNKTEQNEQGEEDTDESDIEKGGSNEPVDFEEILEKVQDGEVELDEDQEEELAKELGIEVEKSEEGEKEEEDIEKSELPESVREKLEKAEEYEEKVENLEKERELDQLEKSAEAQFLPGDNRENAKILKSVKDSSEEDYDALIDKVQAIKEQADASELFKEAGTQEAADTGDAFEKATELAEEKMEKGDYASIASARKEVWNENPELLEEYEKQRQQKV